MIIRSLRFVLIFALAAAAAFAGTKSKAELAELAVSADPAAAAEAVKNLRALENEGLDALVLAYSTEIAKFQATGESTDEWKRIAFALDSVAMQKDAYASQLYWFTDLEKAKKEADSKNKPILSLRLLGNLNEEFSCANSRFFRALLYSNAEVSKYLRENYVLHWQSVRPAPKVTIDFGDGRRIERTLTGNSIHYILDENGAIIDALPGLYSPSGFLKYLTSAAEINKTIDQAPAGEKEGLALRYRKKMFDDIKLKRDRLIAAAKIKLVEPQPKPVVPKDGEVSVTALDAAPRAATKVATELRILTNIDGRPTYFNPEIYDNFSRFETGLKLDDWQKLAGFYAGKTDFDAATTAFIKRQNRRTGLTDAEFAGLLANLRSYVRLDTTRNDFLFHTKLYEWLNSQSVRNANVETFNSRVYAELFKTPDSDKWLGLYETDVYTALDGNGIVK